MLRDSKTKFEIKTKTMLTTSTVSSEGQSVVLLPVGIAGTTTDFVVQMTFTESTVLPSCSCQATKFAMLMHSLAEPVDSGIPTDSLVLRVNQDHFKELEC